MITLMSWLADLATRRSKWVVVFFVLMTVVGGLGASRLQASFRLRDTWDYAGNTLTEQLDRYNEEFGDDGGFAVVIVEADDIFTPPILRYIQQLSRKLKRKPQFRRILSLSLNTVPRGRGDEIVTGPLFEHVPTDPKVLEQIRTTALASRMAVPRLVSADGRYAMVAAEFNKPINQLSAPQLAEGNNAVREAMASTPVPKGSRAVIGGTSVAEEAAPKAMVADQRMFLPIGLVLIIIVIVLSFGSWHGVVLTFSEVIVTLLWTLGFMGYSGLTFNIVSASTPTILMIYGLLDSVFVMAMFYRIYETEFSDDQGAARDDKEDVREAARRTIRRMGPVCLLTSLSTAIGFASFGVGSLTIVRMYGIGLAFGVIVAFLSSIVWMPALICLLPRPKKTRMARSPLSRIFASSLVKLGPFTRRWRWVLITGSVALFAAGAATLYTKSHHSVITIKELPQDMEGIEGINLVADHLLGACSTGVQITGPPGSMQEPRLFMALDELDRWAEAQQIVTSSLSPSDLVRDMHRAFNGGSDKFDKIPADRGLISQYLALLDPPTRTDFITDDYARTHLRIMTKDVGSYRWRKELFEPLQQKARALFKGYQVEFPGYMRAVEGGDLVAVEQLIVGFFIAFVAIAILVGVAFRSARLALLSILPNLLPTTVAMAASTLLGLNLRLSTVVFLSVAVGITFDNTIHLFGSMRECRARGLSHDEAMHFTMANVGPPIVFTSVLIAAGLGIFMVSSIKILFMLGMTAAIVVLLAALSDLLLTTAFLGQWGRLLAPGGGRARARSGGDEPPG